MTDHRHLIPNSRKLFSLLEKIDEVGEVPCQNFPDAFFPDLGARGYQDIAIAKDLCSNCPVIRDCAIYAIEAKEPFGIWGGLTPEDRKHQTKATFLARNPLPSE